MNSEKCIDICNSLLRGELSAVETYDQAIEKFASEAEVAELRSLKADHTRSVNALRDNVTRMGGVPATESGAWGVFAQAVEGTAKLFGSSACLSALKEGEEHGRNEYEQALKNDAVMTDCKQMIQSDLLPRQLSHIRTLDRMIAGI